MNIAQVILQKFDLDYDNLLSNNLNKVNSQPFNSYINDKLFPYLFYSYISMSNNSDRASL